jgi:hypothetical protein
MTTRPEFPCEICGTSAGPNYYSDERSNATGFGVVLCALDAARCAAMDDAAFAKLRASVQADRTATKPAQMAELMLTLLDPGNTDDERYAAIDAVSDAGDFHAMSLEEARVLTLTRGAGFVLTLGGEQYRVAVSLAAAGDDASDDAIAVARSAIWHGTDGPLTPFVVMARACRYAAETGQHQAAANALAEALDQLVR